MLIFAFGRAPVESVQVVCTVERHGLLEIFALNGFAQTATKYRLSGTNEKWVIPG
jgi:hypothetical protein